MLFYPVLLLLAGLWLVPVPPKLLRRLALLAAALPCRIAVFEEDGGTRVSMIGPVELLGLVSDDADVIRRLALLGEGIVYKSWLDVSADIEAGELDVVFLRAGDAAARAMAHSAAQATAPSRWRRLGCSC